MEAKNGRQSDPVTLEQRPTANGETVEVFLAVAGVPAYGPGTGAFCPAAFSQGQKLALALRLAGKVLA